MVWSQVTPSDSLSSETSLGQETVCPNSLHHNTAPRLTEVIKPSVKSKRELRQHGPKSARSANVMSEVNLKLVIQLGKVQAR